jgi:hypothetical protein
MALCTGEARSATLLVAKVACARVTTPRGYPLNEKMRGVLAVG